jgi:hypothetical protein
MELRRDQNVEYANHPHRKSPQIFRSARAMEKVHQLHPNSIYDHLRTFSCSELFENHLLLQIFLVARDHLQVFSYFLSEYSNIIGIFFKLSFKHTYIIMAKMIMGHKNQINLIKSPARILHFNNIRFG